MWGKHFTSMYEGSMRGAGSAFFAVWGYVISHMVPNRSDKSMQVELNTEIIGFLIGEQAEVVAAQIVKMCAPDPKSRTRDEQGRKLVNISEYTYRVVNGAHYREIRNEQDRREYNRRKQAEYRAKKLKKPPVYHRANGSSTPQSGAAATEDEVNRALRLSEPPALNGAGI
jgi:hypothetical protein